MVKRYLALIRLTVSEKMFCTNGRLADVSLTTVARSAMPQSRAVVISQFFESLHPPPPPGVYMNFEANLVCSFIRSVV